MVSSDAYQARALENRARSGTGHSAHRSRGAFPVNWPVGNGFEFQGVYDRQTKLMHLFPDVELEYSIQDGVPVWRYEEFSITRMKGLFLIAYSISANGRSMKKTHSFRKANNELKLLLRKRIMTQVEGIMR